MPITADGLIVPKGGVARKAAPPILLPKRAPRQAVRVGDKAVATSLVRATAVPTGLGTPRAPIARAPTAPQGPRGRRSASQAMAMPSVTARRQWGATVPVRREDTMGGGLSRQEKADLALTKQIAAVMSFHYPGHAWALQVKSEQGVVLINIPLFMGNHYYTIPMTMLKTDPGFRLVIRACGEILERYGIARAGWRPDQFVEAVNKIPAWKRARVGQIPN
jgi:hypothetical protein